VLTPQPEGLPTKDTLSADEKKLYARQMEACVGYQAVAMTSACPKQRLPG
jgi:hypothetical protein